MTNYNKYAKQLGYDSKVKLYLKECPNCDNADIETATYRDCPTIFIECVNCYNVIGELKIPKGYREELKNG